MKKKTIVETLQEHIGLYDFEGGLDSFISMIEGFQDEWKLKGYTNLRLDVGWGYDDDRYFRLMGDREETDREYERRMAKDKKSRERKKADKVKAKEQEKKLYLKLKEKYGD